MKFLDDSGLLYVWSKLKDKLGGKVDKVAGKGLSTNDYDSNAKNKVDKLVVNGTGENYLADDGTYKPAGGTVTDVRVNGQSVLTGKTANVDLTPYAKTADVDKDIADLDARIEALAGLGQYVGTFDSYADIPKSKTGFTHITLNDYVNVRLDENYDDATTRYIATAISDSGAITWSYDITYSTDVSGKMEKVTSPKANNIMMMDATGQAVDSGIDSSKVMLDSDVVRITNEEIDAIMDEE